MKAKILTILGFICVGLGALGIFLPVLPTTPFLLLASWLFWRSNPKWREWLLNNEYLGQYIDSYVKYHAVPLKSKMTTIVILWLTIGVSVALVQIFWVRLFLFGIAVAVTVHVLMLKTLK